ncbi:MAG: hypothetical protein E5W44_09190, partial [Mesorhizobium sp.]
MHQASRFSASSRWRFSKKGQWRKERSGIGASAPLRGLHFTAPPSVLPDISPTWGEIGSFGAPL